MLARLPLGNTISPNAFGSAEVGLRYVNLGFLPLFPLPDEACPRRSSLGNR